MALKLTLGQYHPVDSPIHALDPRTKVMATLGIMVASFFVRTPAQLALTWLFMLAIVAATKVALVHVLRAMAPIAIIALLLGVCNLLLVRDGTVLASIGPIVITAGGVWAALLFPLRLAAATVAGIVLLLTTTPTQLADAFDAFLSPLSHVGLPGHELAMVFALMLRFVPTLADEAASIADAQKARGGTLGEGGIVRRIRAVVPLMVALLASAVRHASDLSRALDARCYVGGAKRTHWHPLHMHASDARAGAAVACYIIALTLMAGV